MPPKKHMLPGAGGPECPIPFHLVTLTLIHSTNGIAFQVKD